MSINSSQSNTQDVADAFAREQALDHTQSFIVSAPAGSGKTGLLTQRILKLLAFCEHPEEVLAITFTRKAAQEMRQRIILALRAAQLEEAPTNKNEQLTYSLAKKVLQKNEDNNWQLLISPNRLRIQTIDGFCQSLVRQLPFDAGMSSLLKPTDTPQKLYQQAVRQFFTAFKADSATQNDIGVLLKHVDNRMDDLEKLLMSLLDKRNQWLGILYETKNKNDGHQFLENSLNVVVAESLIALREMLASWLPELTELGQYAANNAIKDNKETLIKELIDFDYSFDQESSIDTASIEKWKAIATLLLTASNTWRKSITVADGFPAGNTKDKDSLEKRQKTRLLEIISELKEYPEILAQLEDIKSLPSPSIQKQQWTLLDSLTRLLPRLVAEFKILCEQTTECDFNELTQASLIALGNHDEPSDIALKLDYKINHILVDEFQDTSLPQLHLLEKLTAGWQPDDGKTLFVVGDAMQSCYSFREANVGIFLGVKETGISNIELTPLELTVNFRSNGTLVEWVNEHFQSAFPEENNINRGAIRYQHADYFSEPDNNASINTIALVEADAKDEAKHISEIVKNHLQKDDSKNIAILVRAKTHLPAILNQLREENLTWQSKDVDKLASRMAVIDLLSLTKAALNFSDRIAWLSILRAPWCGLDMIDLTTIASHKKSNQNSSNLIWENIKNYHSLNISESGKACLTRIVKVLTPALEQKHRKPLRQWIEGIWLALGGPAAVTNPTEKHSPARFFELLEAHSLSNSTIDDWVLFDEAIEKLYDRSEEQSRIQVMTIHKSKGLEFDTVIIPSLEKTGRADDKALLLWQDVIDSQGEAHLLMSPLGSTGESDEFYSYLKREKSIRQNYENARLLYIGCTRAIQHLYLLGKLNRDIKTEKVKPPAKNSLFSHLWESVQDEVSFVEYNHQNETNPNKRENLSTETSNENDTKKITLKHILRLSSQWEPCVFPTDNTLEAYRQKDFYLPAATTPEIITKTPIAENTSKADTTNLQNIDNKNIPSANNLNHRAQRYIGTVLHQALHHLIQYGINNWNNERIEKQKNFWQNQLRQNGLDNHQASQGTIKIAEAITKIINDKEGRWLLDSSHEQSESELSIMDPNAGFRESIIDRTFIADGVRWIVDFKSSEPAEDENLDIFLQNESLAYRSQLERYSNVIQKIDVASDISITTKTALYFPLLPLFHII
ncbi:MAG: UvrD-helicase domain-containing protein [Cellvibrionaceae bacterium]